MFFKENFGKILQVNQENDSFCWLLPNVFACFHETSSNSKDENVESGGCFIKSPSFSLHGAEWELTIIKNDYNISGRYYNKTPAFGYNNYHDRSPHLGLFLWKILPSSSFHKNYSVTLSYPGNKYASVSGKVDNDVGFGVWDFIYLADLREPIAKKELCVDGHLKIVFRIELIGDISDVTNEVNVIEEDEDNVSEKEDSDPEAKGIGRLALNLKSLLLEGHNSDAVLRADNREFRVHKNILSARSPVFCSMFLHDMAENNSNVVDIPDCTAESFQVFLLYLYTGTADTITTENVFNLYYAADKYHVDDLKAECVEYMTSSALSVDTFCDVIALSLRHGESCLQKTATKFFSRNIKQIIKTVQWQTYIAEYPTHANELLIKALTA